MVYYLSAQESAAEKKPKTKRFQKNLKKLLTSLVFCAIVNKLSPSSSTYLEN